MDTILYFQSPTKTSAPDKIAGVRRHAAVADWHVQAMDGIPSPKALEGLVSFWHPLGIILDCGGGYQEIPTDLFAGLPTVYLDRNPRTMPADTSCVSHDSVATGQLAAKELLVAGHPNFAFVPYPQPRFWSDDRERGFRDALALNGLTCETFDGGGRGTLQSVAWQKSLRRWIEQLPKPCGIFAANDAVAAEVLIAAAQTGFDVPREIAVCGVDNFAPICEHTVPTLTSIQPDFLVDTDEDGTITVTLTRGNQPSLIISPDADGQKDAFVRQYVERGQMFITALQQRAETMTRTMQAIVKLQKPFFQTGDETQLRPMRLEDVANVTGYDISTISRVANSKYVETTFGTYPLKWFFTHRATQNKEGDDVTARQLMASLRRLVDEEDKRQPYSDERLTQLLQQEGFSIARRTIAKYREQMGIPVARMRK
jgi:DNA-binding LacI/PurR family transcriptional regulator